MSLLYSFPFKDHKDRKANRFLHCVYNHCDNRDGSDPGFSKIYRRPSMESFDIYCEFLFITQKGSEEMVRVLCRWSFVVDRISGEENTSLPFCFRQGVYRTCSPTKLASGGSSPRKSQHPVYQPLETLERAIQRLNDLIHAFDDTILLVKYSLGSRLHHLQPFFA